MTALMLYPKRAFQSQRPRREGPNRLPVPDGLHTLTTGAAAVPEVAGTDAKNLTTMELGITGVSTLLIRSFLADRELSPSGVTRQAQQEISSS
jgi:hypothetical protein